jgi:hypothetical protein
MHLVETGETQHVVDVVEEVEREVLEFLPQEVMEPMDLQLLSHSKKGKK